MAEQQFKIEVSADKKRAWLTVFDFNNLTKEQVFDAIIANQIKKGVIIKNISLLFEVKETGSAIEIARYQSPYKAVQDSIKWHVDLHYGPREKGSRIDYYDLGYLKDVKADTKIFTMRKGLSGSCGYLIDGTPIASENTDGMFDPAKMQNIRLVEENGLITGYAENNGVLVVSDQGISVSKKVVIDSDVDFRTGHLITGFADLEINGNAGAKFIIQSPGTVEVKGNLLNCLIQADKLIVRGKIMSGSNLFKVNNLEAAEIVSRSKMYVENCKISGRLGSSDIGINGNGDINQIVDSIVFVKNSLEADIIGGDSAKHTVIVLGVDKDINDRQTALVTEIKEQRKLVRDLNIERVKVKNELDALLISARKKALTEKEEELKIHLQSDLIMLDEDLAKESSKEISLIELHNSLDCSDFNLNAQLIVRKKIYHGTQIFLGLHNSIRLQKDYGPCKISADADSALSITQLEKNNQEK